jgi:hypothetical protein
MAEVADTASGFNYSYFFKEGCSNRQRRNKKQPLANFLSAAATPLVGRNPT